MCLTQKTDKMGIMLRKILIFYHLFQGVLRTQTEQKDIKRGYGAFKDNI